MNPFPAILYVEDDPQSRMIMEVLLIEAKGLSNIFIFEDSHKFLENVNRLEPKPDLILLDIHVRPYSGFDMLAMLREHDDFRDTPVVALTASVMNEEVIRLQTAGFNSVIGKPIDQDTFYETLERILNGEKVWRIVN